MLAVPAKTEKILPTNHHTHESPPLPPPSPPSQKERRQMGGQGLAVIQKWRKPTWVRGINLKSCSVITQVSCHWGHIGRQRSCFSPLTANQAPQDMLWRQNGLGRMDTGPKRTIRHSCKLCFCLSPRLRQQQHRVMTLQSEAKPFKLK